jgi:hypothetical protein
MSQQQQSQSGDWAVLTEREGSSLLRRLFRRTSVSGSGGVAQRCASPSSTTSTLEAASGLLLEVNDGALHDREQGMALMTRNSSCDSANWSVGTISVSSSIALAAAAAAGAPAGVRQSSHSPAVRAAVTIPIAVNNLTNDDDDQHQHHDEMSPLLSPAAPRSVTGATLVAAADDYDAAAANTSLPAVVVMQQQQQQQLLWDPLQSVSSKRKMSLQPLRI